MRHGRSKPPPRLASDISFARLGRCSRAVRRCGMKDVERHPSQESAVHRPSFPAAAITRRDASLIFAARCSESDVRESEADESRKMIRATHAICTRIFGVNRIRTTTRAKCARCASRCALCVVGVAFVVSKMVRNASALRALLSRRAVSARREGRDISRAARAARPGAVRHPCRRRAGGSAGCRPPAPAHAPPSR